MRFVHDDEIRASAQEVMSAAIGLYEIHRDNNERICVKDGLVGPEILLQPTSGAGKDKLGIDVEFRGELTLPLLRQMRRTKNAQARDLPSVQHLAGNQARFHRLANANIIRDQHTHWI